MNGAGRLSVRACAAAGTLLLGLGVVVAQAQTLRAQCVDVAAESTAQCTALADAAVTLPARRAIAAIGGNPVAGTASTLGMRVPGSPRWSIAIRSTLARAALPPLEDERAMTPTFWSVNADLSVGLFNGFNLLPTIGGFASLDVLGSIGVLSVPEGDGFEGTPLTWALGARVGVLRESFTAPGVSISGMYRSVPGVEFGGPLPDAYFENARQGVWSVRGTVGKRILGVGLTGGLGYDRLSSDVTIASFTESPTPEAPATLSDDWTSGRTSVFGNISYTLLILNMAAELGWQDSDDRPAGAHRDTGRGGLFGGIAVRLAI